MTDPLNPRLLAALCHDLRGPLGAMGTWVHVLNSGRGSPETQTRALASIESDVQALGALIEQMSLLGLTLSGSEPISLVPLDLVPLLRSVCSYKTESSDLTVTFSSDVPSLSALVDSSRFQTLACVLTARALTGRSGTRDIRLSRSGGEAELVVESTGGAPRALGIALVRALSESQGGVLVDEAPGRAGLTMRFPLALA